MSVQWVHEWVPLLLVASSRMIHGTPADNFHHLSQLCVEWYHTPAADTHYIWFKIQVSLHSFSLIRISINTTSWGNIIYYDTQTYKNINYDYLQNSIYPVNNTQSKQTQSYYFPRNHSALFDDYHQLTNANNFIYSITINPICSLINQYII